MSPMFINHFPYTCLIHHYLYCLALALMQIALIAFTHVFQKNTPKLSHRMSKTQNITKLCLGHKCYTYAQILYVLQELNVTTTGSMGNNKTISDFLPNVPQHVVVHHIYCSCYSTLHIINICWKWWSINFVFNIPPTRKKSHTVRSGDLAGQA